MELSDISGSTLAILQELKKCKAATAKQMTELLQGKHPTKRISGALFRLEAFGFVEKPEIRGNPWMITPAGLALFGEVPAPASVAVATAPEEITPDPGLTKELEELEHIDGQPEPPEPPTPDFEPMPATSPPDFASELLQAMEIEVALNQVRSRLRVAPIPARASRVYREILAALPASLVDALEPITVLIESAQA